MKKTFVLRTIGFIAGIFLSAVLFSLSGFAESHNWAGKDYELHTEGDYQYIILPEEDLAADPNMEADGEGAYIARYTGSASSIAIPVTLGGKTVKWIGHRSFKDNNAVQTVTIGANIKSINVEAFSGCDGLQNVLIASEVRVIYPSAFSGCSALKNVTFQNGSKLEKIYDSAFDGCGSLIGLKIPGGVKEIYTAAFRNCDSLTDISIPDSVEYLGGAVFFSCDSLRSAEIGDGVSSLDCIVRNGWDNEYNNRYSDVAYGDIADGAFERCVSLEKVSIGSSVRNIGRDCFAGSGLKSVSIPDNVVTVDTGAFQYCGQLKKVSVGDGVMSIGISAFEKDTALETVTIGNSVQSIGVLAFKYCTSLKSIVIPTNVVSLGNAAFYGCAGLRSAVIGNGVVSLGTRTVTRGLDAMSWSPENWGTDHWELGMFEGCVSLKNIYIGSGVKEIGLDCFADTALTRLEIPDNVQSIGKAAFANCHSLKSVKIGKGVRDIPMYGFAYDSALEDLSIGTGVITIGDLAFMKCSALKKVFIPSQVTSLGAGAFFSCSGLETAVVGNGVTALSPEWNAYVYIRGGGYDPYTENWGVRGDEKYGKGAFEGCVNLKNITLGSGLVSIGMDSFAGTALTTITVPQKVSKLERGAFSGMMNLKDVYFAGNWGSEIGADLFYGTEESYKLHYIAGKLGYNDLPYSLTAFKPVTVTFDNNDDDVFTVITEEQIMSPKGDYVIEPIAPVAIGYLFGGWYSDRACKKPWDFRNNFVTNNTTLYAKWTPVKDAPPVRPENVMVAGNLGKTIALSWTAVDGAQSYNVYANGVKVNKSPVTESAYTVAGLKYSSTYEFAVKGVNSKGESEASIIVAANTVEDPLQEFSGHYYLVLDANMSWREARDYAGTIGGHLLCISSQPEQDFAASLLDGNCEKEYYWLGFADEEAKGEYVWVNGEKNDYTNWGDGQPDNWENSEHYGSLSRDGKWNDLPETFESVGLIIEWDSRADAYGTVLSGVPDHPAVPEPAEAAGVRGDADGDGQVTAKDARLVLRASAKLENLSDEAAALCDLNGDGSFTAAEARSILRFSAHLIDSL